MSKKLKLPLLFILGFLFLSLASSSALADIFWSTPQQISTSSNHAILPATVTGPNGFLHTAWTELDPLDPNIGAFNPGVFYSYWNGDAWSDPVEVSQNTDGFAGWPAITATPDNTIHVIWEDDSSNPANSYGRILYSSSTDYGSSWSSPISISTDSLDSIDGSWSWYPQLVTDSAGNLHVIFIYYNDYEWTFAYHTKCAGSCSSAASWSTPERLTINPGYDQINYASIATDSNNNPHVVLEQDDAGSDGTGKGIYYIYFNGSSWSTPEKICSDVQAHLPRIITDSADNRHVTWTIPWYDPSLGHYRYRLEYVKEAGSGWTSPYEVSDRASYSAWQTPIVGLTSDSNDNIYVGWGERIGWDSNPFMGIEVNYKRWTSPSGPWSDPFFLRYAYDLATPFLYKDIWDNQHLAWAEQNGPTGKWSLWFSTIPVNVKDYNQTAFNLYLNKTNDILSIQPNALETNATISAQIGPLPASYDPQYTTIPRSYTFRPHGTTFIPGKEAEAKIHYTDEEVIGSDEANLKLYIWDSTLNDWSTSFTTSVQTKQNTITVDLPHFSLFGIAAPKAEQKVNITWRPPITVTKDETYTMTDGSTLPIKFSLAYEDGTPIAQPTSPEDITVLVRNAGYSQVFEYNFGTADNNIRYDKGNNQCILNLHTRELDLDPGLYNIKVYYKGIPWGTKDFLIVEKGKVKGTSTP